jgi:hypothetical protein
MSSVVPAGSAAPLRHRPYLFYFLARGFSGFARQIAVALLWMKLFSALRDIERLE